MNILVCLSVVPDTTTHIRFRPDGESLDPTGIQWIINPWDELALTRALEIREDPGSGVNRLSVVHAGLREADPVLQKALAVGADSAFRINKAPVDSYETACLIADWLRNESFDLVVAGHDSSDYNGSATGEMLAERMGWGSFSSISALSAGPDGLILTRESDSLTETIRTGLPCVITIQKGIARDPRIPSLRGIMSARSKPLAVIEPGESAPLTRHVKFSSPEPRGKCRMIDPANVDELVGLLRNEANVL